MAAPVPPPAKADRDTLRVFQAAGILAVLAFAAYCNSFGGPFIFDDKPAILENPTLRHLWPLTDVLSPPPIGSSVTGRPLVNLTFALDYAASGTLTSSYHRTNFLIHLLAGLALFGLVRRTLQRPVIPEPLRKESLYAAFFTALLWLLHPLATESVTSIVQRTESQMGLFYLLTLYAFARSLDAERPLKWQAVTVFACALGMATKEVMVTAPVVAFAYDRTFVAGSVAAAWRRRWKFYLVLASTWLVLAWLLLTVGGTRGVAAGFGLGVTPWTYALTQCRAVVLYLKLVFWPHPLVFDYGIGVVRDPAAVWMQALLLAGLVGASLWAWVRRPAVGFLALATFAILTPSSSVVPLISQTIAEHRMYLSLACVLALVVALAVNRFGGRALAALTLVACVLGTLTILRNRDYQSELGIWAQTVERAPDNPRARINLAEGLLLRHRPAEALPYALEAVRLKANYPEAQTNVGIALAQLGRPAEALPYCLEAVRLNPDGPRVQSNLGTVLIQLERYAEGIEHLEASLRLAPDAPDAMLVRNNLGIALLRSGQPAKAIPHFEAVLRADPALANTHFTLAVAYGLCERLTDAERELEAVLRIQPERTDARNALESVRAELAARGPAR
ncbi:MAG TPA: tetratricopeptide repeat protein [Opitutaceae bacterium]|nr:tetratricopeptide repeat protein [Opitutaceae bacterium]HND60479.1 tetratricopeptide repeat protein [Opitutaceae bacterium]